MSFTTRLAAGVLAVSLSAVGIGDALASAKMLSDAKKAGLPANNCQYCHSEAVPKKDTFKPDKLNDRGKALMEDQQKRGLKTPDFSILKNAPGGADKK
jgi:hypothetical protein